MRKFRLFQRKSNDQRGVAVLEFTLVAPLMAMMIIATYDLGSALNQYLALSRVVYEGARYAATLPGLEVTTVSSVDANTPNHNKVRDRVVDLLTRAGFDAGSTVVQTENVNNTWVKVTVVRKYQSIFGFFNDMNIQVSASGPFLSLSPSAGG
ncbi:MAG: TadE family protein [Bdellovibrionota bacterium]